jgi:Fur family ferric uptake transcriptional regulator
MTRSAVARTDASHTGPDRLREAGLRRTPARVAVWSALRAAERPLAHADLSSVLDGLDDITLYRTLAAFEAAGLVHAVHGTDGVTRYGANVDPGPGCPGNHVHFLCGACGAVSCLRDQPLPRVTVPAGATVASRHFLVLGRCAACAERA